METVYQIEELPDGTKRHGNTIEVSREEAIDMIRAGIARHESAPIGVVPAEWEVE